MLLGRATMPGAWKDARYDEARATEMEDRVRLDAALATYARLVARGDDPDAAHVATLRAVTAAGDVVRARAYAEGVAPTVSTDLAHVLRGLCQYRMPRYDLVWRELGEVEPTFLARHALAEAVDTALSARTPEATATARAVVADPSLAKTSTLPRLAGRFLVAGEPDVARSLYDEARGRADLDDRTRRFLDNLARWLVDPAPVPEVPAGRVRVGVLDYHHPDLVPGAGNLGDLIQTLSLLGNLARFQGVRFHGPDGVDEVASGLLSRVRPELRLDGPQADVELVPVSRDFSEGDPIPEDTWLVAFGWHLRPLYRVRYGLPYHPHLRPIFVAFHVNHVRALTPDALDYLRAHGPVGCRDWTTVDLLLGAGVDAFFTGCLTTTVDAVFPHRDQVEREDTVVAAIDVPAASVGARRPVEQVTHLEADWYTIDLAGGLRSADERLQTYLRRYHRIVTSRLHSYLPATSLGVPVEFRPEVPGDVRFDGLLGMQPDGDAFVAMRDGIRALLAEMFGLILAGASEDDVYARWRELTADRVAQARARLAAPAEPVDGGVDVHAAVAGVRASIEHLGPHGTVDPATVSNVAVSLDANYRAQLPVTLESLTSNARGPLRVFVTARGLDTSYRTWLSASFPEIPFTFLTYDDVDYGRITRMLGHVSVATMDRLLLPEVLTDVDRIAYVDIDTVTLGDVTELARTDLGGHPLAGRTERYLATEVWRRAGDLLEPADAHELRRRMAAAHGFGVHTFNAGVMVLDLDRMRRDRFVELFVPMAGRFGLHDHDVLNAYTGRHRAELDPRWNSFPVAESLPDPRLLHYAGAGKPWEDLMIPGGHWWRHYAEQFVARTGAVPDAD